MKRKKHCAKVWVLLLICANMLCGCEKAMMMEDMAPTATNTFDYLWSVVDRQYSMFDVKDVDWQAVYDTTRSKVYDGMAYDSLYAICSSMLSLLNDGHVNLYTSYDVSRADSLYYRFYTEEGIDMNTVVLNYLGINYHSTGGVAHSGLCNGRVIYMYYGSFSSSVSLGQLRHIIESYPEAEGLILDLRGNGGGSLSNVDRLLHILPSHGQKLYSSQIKSGPAHDDFGPWEDTFAPDLDEEDAPFPFTKPVLVLIDKGCYSATSVFAISMQAYENVRLMGDSTSGGLGLPTMGGLPNGWLYRFPVTHTRALDGRNYENGVSPDIYLPFDRQAALSQHCDNIIDSACSLILGTPATR